MDLFDTISADRLVGTPLAESMRPQKLEDFVGQAAVLDHGRAVQRMIKRGSLQSMVLWGPPGCGKTTLAKMLGQYFEAHFIEINAVSAGVKQIKEIGETARLQRRSQQQKTVLFVDEIHRFSKSQQDVLLPFVESGDFVLIGATTENPSYYLNRALLSRSRLIEFNRLDDEALVQIFERAGEEMEWNWDEVLEKKAQECLIHFADGDARKLLNSIESLDTQSADLPLSAEALSEQLGQQILPHDKDSDQHYDLISAYIKSVRGSDPDAAIYYLARMLEGGEDPRFVARRMVILASEDVGNADPKALGIAVDAARAVELIGMPEVRIVLGQATTYLATAPKSNRSYMAINRAMEFVRKTGSLPIPKSLRSASTSLMKSIGYGKGYQYSHDGQKGYIEQNFFPEGVDPSHVRFYEPAERGYEKHIRQFMAWLKGQ